jgi:hypothetical protein
MPPELTNARSIGVWAGSQWARAHGEANLVSIAAGRIDDETRAVIASYVPAPVADDATFWVGVSAGVSAYLFDPKR